jgi:hypothetical protein
MTILKPLCELAAIAALVLAIDAWANVWAVLP